MGFDIGDTVIHYTHGLGKIVDIEEKNIHDLPTNCYVVHAGDLMIWIPIDDLQHHSLRVPTLPAEFVKLTAILTDPSEELLQDRMLRKDQLITQMKDGQLSSICRVVRDLTHFKLGTRLTIQEKFILENATHSLLAEWTYSLGMPLSQAHQAMTDMLAR